MLADIVGVGLLAFPVAGAEWLRQLRADPRIPAFVDAVQYSRQLRFVGAAAFYCYSVALWQMSIWYRRAWSITLKATVDGLIYALLTAGMFGWLWPR